MPVPVFHIGNLVWFNVQYITTQWPSQKLDNRHIGPYAITKVVSLYAYELDFPTSMKYHRVQHVSVLDPVDNDPLPGQCNLLLPPVVVNDAEEWHVEEIFDARIFYRLLQYLVKWVVYDRPDWELAENVNKLEVVDHFH